MLAAVAAGDDWLSAGCGASAAASLMLAQHGPPARLDACRPDWLRRRGVLLAGLRGSEQDAGVAHGARARGTGGRAHGACGGAVCAGAAR